MSIRAQYEEHGALEFYSKLGHTYRNPHEPQVRAAIHEAVRTWELDLGSPILDMACGSGEVTLALRELGASVEGLDPYTGEAFWSRTGQKAEALSFEQISAGALEGRYYPLIICSFALHLVDPSRLPQLVYQLAQVGKSLLVLTPHKRPELQPQWGFLQTGEIKVDRVRVRWYQR